MNDKSNRRRRWRIRLWWTLAVVAVFAVGVWALGRFALRPWREAAVQELVQTVRQYDEQRLLAAAQKVRFLRADEQAAGEVVRLWNGTDWALDLRAAKALNLLGGAAVPALLSSVEDKTAAGAVTSHDLVRWARSAQDPSAVGRLCDAIAGHPDGVVRRTLIEVLAARCPAEEKERWLLVFADVEGDVQAASGPLGRLGVFGRAATCVQEALCLALHDADPAVRAAAADALTRFRPRDAAAWDSLTRAVADESASVRLSAARALATIDPRRAAFVLPVAVAGLSSDDPSHRILAAYAIAAVDPSRFAEAWPGLRATLQHDALDMRLGAVLAIRAFGANATPAVPELIAKVQARRADAKLGRLAMDVLTEIGVAAGDARVEDFYLANVGAVDWQERTLWELVGFARNGSQRSLAALTAALAHDDSMTRGTAATCLGLVGPPARGAVPVLQKALEDDSEGVRRSAAEAIQKISPPNGAGQGGEIVGRPGETSVGKP